MKTAAFLKFLDVLLATLDAAETFRINWAKVKELQDRARAENRPISAAERQELIDESQGAIDDL